MKKQKQPCETLPKWLKDNLGPCCLAPLTGTDSRALAAAVQIIDLYSVDADCTLPAAFGIVVARMQRSCWPLAYHAIAHVMDWSDRERVWKLAGLPKIQVGQCKYEREDSLR